MRGPLLLALGVLAAAMLTAKKTSSGADNGPPPAPGRPHRVLLAGDSIMAGTALKVKAKKIGVAVVGETLAGIAEQIESIPAEGFDAVVISGGTNDLAAGATAEQIAERAAKLWKLARQKGWRVAHFELTPFGGGYYESKMSDAERRRANLLLARTGGAHIIDTNSAVADPSNLSRLRNEYAAPDRLHLNAQGYEALGNLVDQWLDYP